MKFFNDSTGKQYQIDVNVGSVERVKVLCEIDLTQLFSDELKLLSRLFEDPAFLTRVLWALCGTGEIGPFLAVMKGDSLENAAKALVDDVIDFFPNSRRRELCRATVAKLWETVDAGQTVAEAKLKAFDPTSLISAGG